MSNDKQFIDFKKEVEKLKEIDGAEEYAKQLAHLFLGNGLSLQTILLMAIDFGQQHPHWIPVEEEMPPLHYEGANSTDFVLIWDGDDVLIAYYDFKEKKWYNEEYGALIIPATHWMPIVSPRKEE